MYCPACGAEFTSGLRYCKRCGSNLSEPAQLPAPVPPLGSSRSSGAAWAVAMASTLITLGGLGIIFATVHDLVRPMLPGMGINGNITAIAITMLIFGSATVFGVVSLLIRLFTRLLTAPAPVQTAQPMVSTLAYPQLGATQPSVTEHTTRTFRSPVYDEAQARE